MLPVTDLATEEPITSTQKTGRIDAIETVIVDLPLKRPHFHASGTHATQSLVIVTLRTADGAIGYGEGGTPGGTAFWGGECAETIKVIIDRYLAPAVIGLSIFAHESLLSAMDRSAGGNHFAKAAIDMAASDAAARAVNVPISAFYGGAVRTSIPVLWALATAAYEADVEDAQRQLSERRHRTFKIKIGKGDPEVETQRAIRTAEAIHSLSAEARCTVDLNQAWDEPTARRLLPRLQDAGFTLIEQPIASWNVAGMARIAGRLDIPLLADESLWDFHDAYDAFVRGATSVYAVKIAKGGGLRRAYKAAATAEAAGIPLYGGMALESSYGTGAGLQLFSALAELPWGCELIGPRLLAEDLTTSPAEYGDFQIKIPLGPGTGFDFDPDKVRHFTRPS
ncbi:muconate/chloromuconate family cycloisomerase [Rhizorhabdus sp.]|uniref:muconate/chloromuconate family cycloisomerase n=1 Tax=Rhizorhabdus sp. TaxID=1968843 RepID=UPI00041103F0|nr:muconate/chloromuconate family cycloisomerase [Rhizorhabdus sp.]MBP8232015.1 muconate/chloromuconate family cycloisomerase [Rhizorhabdus sp.]